MEDTIINLLLEQFPKKIKVPGIRMWYDILVYDCYYGWIPVNIKTTTTFTSDNTGNLAMCVYSYTDEILDIHRVKSYENGKMSDILFNKLKNKEYNTNNKKEFYNKYIFNIKPTTDDKPYFFDFDKNLSANNWR